MMAGEKPREAAREKWEPMRDHLSCRVSKTVKKSRYYCVTCGARLRWDRFGGICSENEMGHPKGGEWLRRKA